MKTSNAKFLNKLALISTVAIIAATGVSAQADTTTKDLEVSANVIKSCIITTTPLAFGAYNPVTSATLDATGNINVACTNGTAGAYITLSEGENSLDSINRRLTDGTNFLPYTLSSDSNRSQVWLPSTQIPLDTFTATTQDTIVYGRIASNQNVPVGDYSDTVVVTVTF